MSRSFEYHWNCTECQWLSLALRSIGTWFQLFNILHSTVNHIHRWSQSIITRRHSQCLSTNRWAERFSLVSPVRWLLDVDLDRVTNLQFNETTTNQTSGIITFTSLRGNYDRIELNCSAIDRRCLSERTDVTAACPSCSSFTLSSIVGGLRYQCRASTIKAGFPTSVSAPFNFSTRMLTIHEWRILDHSS